MRWRRSENSAHSCILQQSRSGKIVNRVECKDWSKGWRRETLLNTATCYGSTGVVRLLLQHKADTSVRGLDKKRFCALLYHEKTQKWQNCCSVVKETSKQTIKRVSHFSTMLPSATKKQWYSCYSNITQIMKQEIKTRNHLFNLHI